MNKQICTHCGGPIPSSAPAVALAERIRAHVRMSQYRQPGQTNDHYLLDGASVLATVEKLIEVAAITEQLLQCAWEFSKEIQHCSELFDFAGDKIYALKKHVGAP
jgi:hypothetical protein